MKRKKQGISIEALSADYKEVSVGFPLALLLIVLLVAGGPLVWGFMKINAQGTASTGVAKYVSLAKGVQRNVSSVRSLLEGHKEEYQQVEEIVPLVVPEMIPVEVEEPEGIKPLEVEIRGIYMSRAMPLVDLDGQTYAVGDMVQEIYKITKIDETSIWFTGPDNEVVVKDLYESLSDVGE